MFKKISRFFFVVFSLSLLLVIILFCAVFFGTNWFLVRHSDFVEKKLSDALGVKISLNTARIAYLPRAGIILEDVTVSWSDCYAPVNIGMIFAQLDLVDLVHRHITFDRLILNNPASSFIIKEGQFSLASSGVLVCASDNLESRVGTITRSNLVLMSQIIAKQFFVKFIENYKIGVRRIAVSNGDFDFSFNEEMHKLKQFRLESVLDIDINKVTFLNTSLNGAVDDVSVDMSFRYLSIDFDSLWTELTGFSFFVKDAMANGTIGKNEVAGEPSVYIETAKYIENGLDVQANIANIDVGAVFAYLKKSIFKDVNFPFDGVTSGDFRLLQDRDGTLNLSVDAQIKKGVFIAKERSVNSSIAIDGIIKLAANHEISLDEVAFNGGITFKNFIMDNPSVRLEGLTLKGLELKYSSGRYYVKSNILMNDVNIVHDENRYVAKSISGTGGCSTKSNGSKEITGNLFLDGFGFADLDTDIREVKSKLKDINISISPIGDIVSKVMIEGTNILLSHESVKIEKVDMVKSLLTVEIPSAGGYSVHGPVEVSNGSINVLDRGFSGLSSTVQMFISSPKKTFSTNYAEFIFGDYSGSFNSSFEMTDSAYSILETNILCDSGLCNSGTIKTSGLLLRGEDRTFKFPVIIQDMPVAFLLALLSPNSQTQKLGYMTLLKADLHGKLPNALDNLSGTGEFTYTDGELFNETFVGSFFRELFKIPPFSLLNSSASQLGEEGAQEARGNFEISQKKVKMKELVLRRNKYTVVGNGSVSFDKEVDIDAVVELLRETAESFGVGVPILENLFGSLGKIVVPIKIRGHMNDIKLSPDYGGIAKHGSGFGLIESALGAVNDIGKDVRDAMVGERVVDSADKVDK